MARVLVNPRFGAKAKAFTGQRPFSGSGLAHARDMRDILGVYDQMVYDTVAKKYFPATRSDLPG